MQRFQIFTVWTVMLSVLVWSSEDIDLEQLLSMMTKNDTILYKANEDIELKWTKEKYAETEYTNTIRKDEYIRVLYAKEYDIKQTKDEPKSAFGFFKKKMASFDPRVQILIQNPKIWTNDKTRLDHNEYILIEVNKLKNWIQDGMIERVKPEQPVGFEASKIHFFKQDKFPENKFAELTGKMGRLMNLWNLANGFDLKGGMNSIKSKASNSMNTVKNGLGTVKNGFGNLFDVTTNKIKSIKDFSMEDFIDSLENNQSSETKY